MIAIATGSPSAPQADPLSGTAYRVVRRIGHGAMGQVFEAEHTGLRRRVAVKLLCPALASDPGFVDRLRLEAQALASVRHPNVVMVYDHATTSSGVPFLAMELLHGRTLHNRLREGGPLPLVEALCLIDQVFAGLMAIHAAGLTHRDLKPGNIFLCDDGGRTVVKLLDFGLVKVTPRAAAQAIAPLRFPTQKGQVLGTPRCMAPEQIMGNACDARTDIYATGVLLFLLLSGRDPFHEYRTELEILTAHMTEAPPLLSKIASQHIPAAMDAVVARALAKDPAARFASMAAFGAALSASLSDAGRVPVRRRDVTEKIDASTFRSAPPRPAPASTAPIDASVFRAGGSALPFVPADGRTSAPPTATPVDPSDESATVRTIERPPPSFGLPPLAPVVKAEAAPSLPVHSAPAPSKQQPEPLLAARNETTPSGESVPAAWMQDKGLWYAVIALLWCLLGVVAWRVL